jgi:hypothetical protein
MRRVVLLTMKSVLRERVIPYPLAHYIIKLLLMDVERVLDTCPLLPPRPTAHRGVWCVSSIMPSSTERLYSTRNADSTFPMLFSSAYFGRRRHDTATFWPRASSPHRRSVAMVQRVASARQYTRASGHVSPRRLALVSMARDVVETISRGHCAGRVRCFHNTLVW